MAHRALRAAHVMRRALIDAKQPVISLAQPLISLAHSRIEREESRSGTCKSATLAEKWPIKFLSAAHYLRISGNGSAALALTCEKSSPRSRAIVAAICDCV